MDTRRIAIFIKELRKERDLTQEELGEALYVSSRTVSRWETGSSLPDLMMLQNIADYFEVDIRELIDGERRRPFCQDSPSVSGNSVGQGSNANPSNPSGPEVGTPADATISLIDKEAEKAMDKETVQKFSEYSSKKETRLSRKMVLLFLLIFLILGAVAAGILLDHRNRELNKTQERYIVGQIVYFSWPDMAHAELALLDSEGNVYHVAIREDTRISDTLTSRIRAGEKLLLVAQVSYTERDRQEAFKHDKRFLYTALRVDRAEQGRDYETAPAPVLSPNLSQAMKQNWEDWYSLTPEEQMLSSAMPGTVYRYFTGWREACEYVGYTPWNFFEGGEMYVNKNFTGSDILLPGTSQLQHVYLSFEGERSGEITQVTLTAGYEENGTRIIYTAELIRRMRLADEVGETIELSPSVKAEICRNQGAMSYSICLYYRRGDVFYTVEIISPKGEAGAQASYEKVLDLLKGILAGAID